MHFKAAALLVLLIGAFTFGAQYNSQETVSLSDQQIFNLQIRDIERKVRWAFATEGEFPETNLVPIISAYGTIEYKGFVPHALPSMDDAITEMRRNENQWNRIATSQLRYSDDGQRLVSEVAGRVEIVGSGRGFMVLLPECRPEICGAGKNIYTL
jgi:hypothetical protein